MRWMAVSPHKLIAPEMIGRNHAFIQLIEDRIASVDLGHLGENMWPREYKTGQTSGSVETFSPEPDGASTIADVVFGSYMLPANPVSNIPHRVSQFLEQACW